MATFSPPYTVVLGAFARSGNTATYSGGSCVSVVMSWMGGFGGPKRKRPGMPMRTIPTRREIPASRMPRRASLGRLSVTPRPASDINAAAIAPYRPHLSTVSRAIRNGRIPRRYPTGPARSTSAEATARAAPNSTTQEREGFPTVGAIVPLPLLCHCENGLDASKVRTQEQITFRHHRFRGGRSPRTAALHRYHIYCGAGPSRCTIEVQVYHDSRRRRRSAWLLRYRW